MIILPQEPAASGDFIVASNSWGDILIRRYREKDGQVCLAVDHPEYPAVLIEGGTRVHGKVIDIWRRIRV